MTTTSIKLFYKDQLRRVAISLSNCEDPYTQIANCASNLFEDLRGEMKLTLSYVDDEGDIITCDSNSEVKEALAVLAKFQRAIRFDISNDSMEPVSAANVEAILAVEHPGVTCDGCGLFPITGPRFKCSIRKNFDLCSACESREVQPFPTLKIYDPQQSPASFIVTLHEDQPDASAPWMDHAARGAAHSHQHHGHPRGPHGHHPHGHGHGFFQDISRMLPWRREKLQKRWERRQTQKNAARSEATSEKPRDDSELETDLITLAINESIESASKESMSSTLSESVVEANKPSSQSSISPRLMARFIRDIACPDGSSVPAGSTFCKIWCLRNDGVTSWPAGVSIVPAGGDVLCERNAEFSVPAYVMPGDEVQVSAHLSAPNKTGRHVAYFRLKNPENDRSFFGQRLWVDVMITESASSDNSVPTMEEEDVETGSEWQVVSDVENQRIDDVNIKVETMLSEPSPVSLESFAALGASLSASSFEGTSETEKQNLSSPSQSFANSGLFTPITEGDGDCGQRVGAGGESVVQSDSKSHETSEKVKLDQLAITWSRELSVLADMGFDDVSILIPLLNEHVGVPVSLSQESNGHPSAEGMQRVVIAMLGASLRLN